jgi:2-polyprenyl-3-methyl-5-hydroxy-6-metoxy-1,4-benzoquinol methylase
VRADWPELSDLLLETDPVSLERKPVRRADVLARLRSHGMRTAERIVAAIPGGEVLDPDVVDGILVRSHCELQRLSFEFRNGQRLLQMLHPLLDAIRAASDQRPLRVVDIGCGMGFVLRWLAAFGQLEDDVELLGCDFNPTLIRNAQALAREERLRCEFRVANAFTLERPAHVFLSTGLIHHFRGPSLTEFFRMQASVKPWGLLHCDIKASWAAPLGSWLFHQARMREPLARHDGVLSAVRAHPREVLLSSAKEGAPELAWTMFDGRPSLLPLLRTLQTVVGVRPELSRLLRTGLGPLAPRLEAFS